MQKWEYLTAAGAGLRDGELTFFDTEAGARKERFKGAEFHKRLALLGEEGWELVMLTGAPGVLWFKRPKQ